VGARDGAGLMRERPILFSAPMVRALLAGTKTQTRRPMKGPRAESANWNRPGLHAPIAPYTNGRGSWNFVLAETGHGTGDPFSCPCGVPGDRLWVKETIRLVPDQEPDDGVGPVLSCYAADGDLTVADAWPWKRKQLNSIHCPRGLSRITLELTDVRVERLQEISEADALAEGLVRLGEGWQRYHVDPDAPIGQPFTRNPVLAYRGLWESINGHGSWDANPWVWAVEFRRV
jgi:hypothetical protein